LPRPRRHHTMSSVSETTAPAVHVEPTAAPQAAAPQSDEPPAAEIAAVVDAPKPTRRILRAFGFVMAAFIVAAMTGATGYVSAHHHVHTGVYPIPASTYTAAPAPPPAVRAPLDHSGDLRRFLLKRPRGARQSFVPRATRGTMTLKQVASFYGNPKNAEQFLVREGFKTAATVNWIDVAGNQIEIRMSRYATSNQAWIVYSDEASGVESSKELKGASSSRAWKVPYSDGSIYTNGKKNRYGDQLSRGIALRGDVVINIWIYQNSPQSLVLTQALLYQQWSKL
jgi:hypothetical protein